MHLQILPARGLQVSAKIYAIDTDSRSPSIYSLSFAFAIAPSLLLSGTSFPFLNRINAGNPYTLYSWISLGFES